VPSTENNPNLRPVASCASCGRDKREANFWFIAWITAERFQVAPWGKAALGQNGKPLCGSGCLLKELDRWATTLRNREGK